MVQYVIFKLRCQDEFTPVRTAPFVLGNRPDRVDKAINKSADVVIHLKGKFIDYSIVK